MTGVQTCALPIYVLLAPPFIMEERHADEIVEKLAAALDRTFEALSVAG